MLYLIGWGSVGPTPNPSGGGEVWSVWGGVKIRIININWAIISKHGDFLSLC